MRAMSAALVIMAKAPIAGQCKTRLCPPLEPAQAATVAEAALADTLQAMARTPAARHVLVLDGEPGPWLPPGFELLAGALERLGDPANDAVLGPTPDGGYWAIGLGAADPSAPWTRFAATLELLGVTG